MARREGAIRRLAVGGLPRRDGFNYVAVPCGKGVLHPSGVPARASGWFPGGGVFFRL